MLSSWFKKNAPLGVILTLSFACRVALALQGGQYFFPDESRYSRGALVYLGLQQHDWPQVFLGLSSPEHAGFTIIATVLTPLQHALAWLGGHGDWSALENYYDSAPQAAMLLALGSTLCLWLVHRLALVLGAPALEANLVALLAGTCAALFYYSRHLLSYDWAIAAALGAFILAFTPTTRRRQLASGICASLCCQIYNGYWFLVPLVGIALAMSIDGGTKARLRGFALWAAAGVTTSFGVMLPGMLIEGRNYFAWLAKYGNMAATGFAGRERLVSDPPEVIYGEGWSLPWQYFWSTEGGLGIAIALVVAAALIIDIRQRRLPRRVVIALGFFAAIYLLLTVESTGLHRLVVYARTVRPLLPFLCLLGGYAIARFMVGPRRQAVAIASIVVLAATNFGPHFTLLFPREVERRVTREFGRPGIACAFDGTARFDPTPVSTRRARPDLVLVNSEVLLPIADFVGYPPGEVLFSVPHPSTFVPYQFEGHEPRERALLRRCEVAIKLIRVSPTLLSPNAPGSDR